ASRRLKKSASVVLASFRPSTGTRPPHHSAARTDVVLLIRRTVRPRGYASGLHSLRPCRTTFLSLLQECSAGVPREHIFEMVFCSLRQGVIGIGKWVMSLMGGVR